MLTRDYRKESVILRGVWLYTELKRKGQAARYKLGSRSVTLLKLADDCTERSAGGYSGVSPAPGLSVLALPDRDAVRVARSEGGKGSGRGDNRLAIAVSPP